MSRVTVFLDQGIERGHFPSYSFLTARGREVGEERASGLACVEPEKVAAGEQTIYDLASLTKPLATALIALLLRRQRLLRLEDQVRRFIPAYEWEGRSEIEIWHLLAHCSGLPDWLPVYLFGYERKEILKGIDHAAIEYAPGTDTRYSCIGYIQLGRILEQAAGESLDQLFATLVARPLGLESACFNPPASLAPRIAATERGNEFERRKCGGRAASYAGFRSEMIHGTVHDHNCFSLGGAAGNAGLFATARDVHRVAAEILDPRTVLRPDESALYFQNMTDFAADHRSIGLQLQTAQDSVAGPELSSRAGAHTGFTGTSLAIDPDRKLICILLTNRIHPEYREFTMNAVRREFHGLAVASS